ncbi:hypothetical protein QFZ67_000230 [Streptomyces sp. V1I1]|nr:hypothetical protein [Streptomyces sp. V1I1]
MQDESGEQLFGQLDFVGGLVGSNEGEGEGALGLGGGAFAGDAVFLGFGAGRAVQLMREQVVRGLPVVENGHPVGIVSLGDLAIERDPGSALGDISSAEPNQ